MVRIKLAIALCGLPLVLASTGCSHLHSKKCATRCAAPAPACSGTSCAVAHEQQRFDQIVAQGNIDSQVSQLRNQIDETLHSNVQLGMSQNLEFGELEVDYDKLQEVMAKRQRQLAEEKAIYEQCVAEQEKAYKDARAQQLRDYLDSLPEQYAKSCCAPGPGGKGPGGAPQQPVAFCPPPLKLPDPPAPPKLSMPATEIPFVVPVTLKMNVGDTSIGCPKVCRKVNPCCQHAPGIRCKNCPTEASILSPPPAPEDEGAEPGALESEDAAPAEVKEEAKAAAESTEKAPEPPPEPVAVRIKKRLLN